MERIIRTIAILIFVICTLFSTGKVVYGVGEYCGEVRYYTSFKADCEKATAPACNAKQTDVKSARCTINSQGKCTASYFWSGCYSKIDASGDPYCDYIENDHYVTVDCDVAGGGGGGGGNYEYTRCPEGQVLSCGTVAEAGSQNKKFCGYKITCNKYYWPSAFNQPEPCNVNNVASTTCTYNCSCCPIGQYRSCTLGASYTNTVSLYVGGGDPVDGVYNQMMKDTCYRDGVKRRNDVVSDNPSANTARIHEFLDARRAICAIIFATARS